MTSSKDPLKQGVVLVADDSPDALSLIHDTLEAVNMEVLLALDGKQALTIAQRIRPDMILLDAMMPNMDGFEACRALKADPNLAAIPVIFMTGLSDTNDIIQGLEAGGVDYLTKPIKPTELVARMRVHLNNARQVNNAQSALDSMGQHLITTTSFGQITWATPQTYALFAKARASQQWQETSFASQIKRWLSHQPDMGNVLKLSGLDYPLGIKLMGYTEQETILLKLEDGIKPNDVDRLKNHLHITERESEVLRWIAKGKTNREIATILNMSPRTVNKHLEQIFPKLGVENRTSAAAVALNVLVRD